MTLPKYPQVPCRLIGIHGLKQSGKDSVALYLHQSYQNVWREAFADTLKYSASVLFGVPYDEFNDPELKAQIHPHWGITRRFMLQFFGTEMVRDNMGTLLPSVGEDFWYQRLAYRLNGNPWDDVSYDEEDTVIIPDVRFQNEYNWIMANNGIVIHLTRPRDSDIIDPHKSEQPIIFTVPEATYALTNDGTLEELYLKIDKLFDYDLKSFSLIRKQISTSEQE